MNVTEKLLSKQDTEYKAFHSRLMPTVDENRIIGIRIPVLRNFAKELSSDEAKAFIQSLPHACYEENNLHAFLIERIGDYGECMKAVNAFLPFVDNWATCDSLRPKVFKKHLPELLEQIKIWINSDHVYTVRFGLEMLMRYYLDGAFRPEYLTLAASVKSGEYYVNMMLAWFFATALAKQYEATLPFIENNTLDKWTHNKTIQKAVESYRITTEQKEYLKKLKRN